MEQQQLQVPIPKDSEIKYFNRVSKSEGVRLKLVLVGDNSVGKTCLITNYIKNKFDEENYIPTVLDVYIGDKNVNGKTVEVNTEEEKGQ